MATAPVPSTPDAVRAHRRGRRGFPAPVTVRRPAPGVLVVAEARARALVRLAVWLAVVGGFAVALLGAGEAGSDAGARWLALLVPLVLLPYLVDGVRVLWRPREVVFDGEHRELRARGRAPVVFAAIRAVEVRAVNATCEEADAQVRLADGAAVALATGYRFEPVMALAREAAGIAGVPVHVVGAGGVGTERISGAGEPPR